MPEPFWFLVSYRRYHTDTKSFKIFSSKGEANKFARDHENEGPDAWAKVTPLYTQEQMDANLKNPVEEKL
jgi:hypothetical protein